MSAYKEWDEQCNPEQIVRLYSNATGKLVYSFCQEHQDEFVHPKYAFNLDYFRMAREFVIKEAEVLGKPPCASVPHSRIETKVYTNPQSLAEALFQAEVSDEQE